MEYTDDEQVEKLKAWWKSYGNALILGVVIGLGILFGGRYWNQMQLEKAAQASLMFDQLVFHVQAGETGKIRSVGKQLVNEYDRTPYAGLAALILARTNYESNEKEVAKGQLAWAMDNAREEGVRYVARLRLGRIQLAENNLPGAESLLAEGPMTGFEFEYYELAGDVQKQKGDREAAKTSYQKALTYAAAAGKYADVIRMKLDNLG